MTRVAVMSANLGNYDRPAEWPDLIAPLAVEIEVIRLTDADFPPRPLAMTSRLQCGIPKWFGADFAPDADVIVWVDASCAPTPIAVPWFLDRLGSGDIAVFRHPDRRTVAEEYGFVTARMARPGERYLTSRYRGEDFDGMFARCPDRLPLYASTAFAYRATQGMQDVLRQVFLWKARHCLHDQLAFPYVLNGPAAAWVEVRVIQESYLKCDALTYVRNSGKAGLG